jgi:hypothetical protein
VPNLDRQVELKQKDPAAYKRAQKVNFAPADSYLEYEIKDKALCIKVFNTFQQSLEHIQKKKWGLSKISSSDIADGELRSVNHFNSCFDKPVV